MKKSKKFSPMQNKVLGVDPGYGRIGFAVITGNKNNQRLVHSECFETSSNASRAERLALVAHRVRAIIKQFSPNKMAVEDLLWSKNVKTAIGVAEARGVILSEGATKRIPIFEYNPNTIKLAVTGYGKADKKQVESMLHKLLKIKKAVKFDDEYDAIAVALACVSSSYPVRAKNLWVLPKHKLRGSNGAYPQLPH